MATKNVRERPAKRIESIELRLAIPGDVRLKRTEVRREVIDAVAKALAISPFAIRCNFV